MSYDNRAQYCDVCHLWLNGNVQAEDHKVGKQHKKNQKKRERAEAAATAMRAVALTIASKLLREAAYREKQTHIRTALLIANKLHKAAVTAAE